MYFYRDIDCPKLLWILSLPPALLHIRIDAAFPASAECFFGANGADRFADHIVVERCAHLVAFIVYCTLSGDAEAGRFLCCVNICTEKQYGDFEMYVDWRNSQPYFVFCRSIILCTVS